mgnify:CR=1 FL=1
MKLENNKRNTFGLTHDREKEVTTTNYARSKARKKGFLGLRSLACDFFPVHLGWGL